MQVLNRALGPQSVASSVGFWFQNIFNQLLDEGIVNGGFR